MTGPADQTGRRIERAVSSNYCWLGLCRSNIMVDGRKNTDADAIKAIINLEKGDPIFAFDPSEAKGMLENSHGSKPRASNAAFPTPSISV